jgi:hypothetical protein
LRQDFLIFNPAEIRAVEIAIGDLKLGAGLQPGIFHPRAGNVFMSDDLAEQLFPALQFDVDELTGPKETDGIRGNNDKE